MWLIALVKWWVWVLLLVVAALLAGARGFWWLWERLPSRREKERQMSETFNLRQHQDSEEVHLD